MLAAPGRPAPRAAPCAAPACAAARSATRHEQPWCRLQACACCTCLWCAGAAAMRCRLKHIESGRDVVFVNTHLDHEVRAQQQQQLDGARRRRAPPLGAQAVCAPELDPAPFFTHTLPHPNATHTSPPPSPPPPPRTRWRRRRRRRRWQGEQPRVRGAQLIVNRIPEKAPDCPVILVGDLNAGGAAREHATAACARAACAAVQASPPHQACCSAADPACVGHLPPADATPLRPPTPPPPPRARVTRHTSHVTRRGRQATTPSATRCSLSSSRTRQSVRAAAATRACCPAGRPHSAASTTTTTRSS
jgi:hypothetical protein